MNTARVWIFRALVLIGAGTFVYSFFAPWWIARCSSAVAGDGDVIVHPYGLDDGGFGGYFVLMPDQGSEVAVPDWLIILIWVFFGAALLGLLLGIIFNKKTIPLFGKNLNISRWAVGLVGILYLLVAGAGMAFAYSKINALGLPFIGNAWVDLGNFAMWKIELDVTAWIPFGYYLALGTGVYLLLLGIFRNLIVGKSAE